MICLTEEYVLALPGLTLFLVQLITVLMPSVSSWLVCAIQPVTERARRDGYQILTMLCLTHLAGYFIYSIYFNILMGKASHTDKELYG